MIPGYERPVNQLVLVGVRMKIYLTHCCAKKDNSFANTKEEITPDRLYIATPTKRFMKRCKETGVSWGIFSDYYGVWLSHEKHIWYGDDVGDPSRVNDVKFRELVTDFENKLAGFETIYFYHNPGRFHQLYKRLLREVHVKVIMISHLAEIV
jgi:hypothetical protein